MNLNIFIKFYHRYKTLLHFLSSNLAQSFIGIVSGFFTYKYVFPDQLGVWSLFLVFEVYATIGRLGIINGLGRELPFAFGNNNINKATTLASTALYYTILSNILLLILIPFILWYNNLSIFSGSYLVCFLIILVKIILSSYSSFLSVTFRTNEQFNALSKIMYIQTIVRTLLIALIVLFGFYGLIIRELIINISETILLHVKRPLKIKAHFDKKSFVELFKIGFPLFLNSYLIGFIETLPRLYIIKNSTTYNLGLFSPVFILIGTAGLLPTAITSYLYPKLAYSYGLDQCKFKLWRKVKYTLLISFLISIPSSLAILIFSDKIISFFPKYIESIEYIKLSAISLPFISFKVGIVILAILKKWIYLFSFTLIYLLVQVSSLVILQNYFTQVLFTSTISLIITFGLMYIISFGYAYKVTH